jgi:hypothetical protein
MMRSQSVFRLCGLLLVFTLAAPQLARAQSGPAVTRDPLWNGMLIGAGVGAAAGMLFAPQALCGAHDTECSVIVRAVIGIPALAGGIGIGALVDGLSNRSATVPFRDGRTVKPKLSGVQMTVTF